MTLADSRFASGRAALFHTRECFKGLQVTLRGGNNISGDIVAHRCHRNSVIRFRRVEPDHERSPSHLCGGVTRTMAFHRRGVPVEGQSSSSQLVTDGPPDPTGWVLEPDRSRRSGRGAFGRPDDPRAYRWYRSRLAAPLDSHQLEL